MIRKKLKDGTMVDKVDHLLQSPDENLADMIVGFFNPIDLTNDEIEKICIDCLEEADNTFSIISIAEVIIKYLSDYSFARDVYKRAEEISYTSANFKCLAISIQKNLNDPIWYGELIKESVQLSEFNMYERIKLKRYRKN